MDRDQDVVGDPDVPRFIPDLGEHSSVDRAVGADLPVGFVDQLGQAMHVDWPCGFVSYDSAE